MATIPNTIEIFERHYFLGKKYVFTRGGTDLKTLNLKTAKISVKVKGPGSWKLWSDRNLRGKAFTLETGNHWTLGKVPDEQKGVNVMSVEALWLHMDPVSEDYPQGDAYRDQWAALGAWFLGPKAENMNLFNELATTALTAHGEFRQGYFPTDPLYITDTIKAKPAYTKEVAQIRRRLRNMCDDLTNSVPLVSTRFQGHMNWDVTMPANLGYLAALLYNANNVANEASPVTTRMEITVGNQLCDMLGYDMNGTPTPWGHVTADGSIANLEAMWSARNVKFYPLTVKKALKEDSVLSAAKDYKIKTAKGETKKLTAATTWELLNLDVDQIVAMPQKIAEEAGISPDDYTEIVDKNNLANLGWHDFMAMFGLQKQAVVAAPMSNHYSWPKAATLLGIGQKNLIGVEFDENARMSLTDLKRQLTKCLEENTPIISVVCVMGTTEESAVDPLADVLNIRDEYRKKGLNFAINCDGAWGGYFCAMLHEPKTPSRGAYVPNFPLSTYTKTQLLMIKHADTCTLDPHKSGFASYPAGGLCYRNEAMRGFVQVHADVVYHAGDDPSIGTWGVEGSKPGAAAAGVLLGHEVIGLDNNGFGRILGQCVFGAKLFYCMWLCLAKDDDPFVCVPMKPIDGIPLETVKTFIKDNIYGKTSEELVENEKVMEFLKQIGPDTLINAFAVNQKGNTDLEVCNSINYDIFERTSHTNDIYNIKRVHMILTQSKLPPMVFGDAVKQFKRRLGLPDNTTGGLKFLINTVMNPWATANDGVEAIGRGFRYITLNAIGALLTTRLQHQGYTTPRLKSTFRKFDVNTTLLGYMRNQHLMTDAPDIHGFVATGNMTMDGEIFGDHIAMFTMAAHQYHAIAKFKFKQRTDIETFRNNQQNGNPLITFANAVKKSLGPLLRDGRTEEFEMNVYIGFPKGDNSNRILANAIVQVVDIPRFKHFDTTATSYPENMSYFMYGDGRGAYLSHNMTKKKDFQQVVKLDQRPADVDLELLVQGLDITIPELSGSPVYEGQKIVDPLKKTEYTIECPYYDGDTIGTTIQFKQSNAKIYFDSEMINN